MLRIEGARGILGPAHLAYSGHSAQENREIWTTWDWSQGGNEWNDSAETELWKATLIEEVLVPNLGDARAVLEIGPGAGRWSEVLQPRVDRLAVGDCVAISPLWARVDIGANLGYFTAVLAQCVGPAGRVRSFEPVPETYELLELCRSLNGYAHVTPMRLALGAASGSSEITYDRRHSGIATMHPDHVAGDTHQIELRSLDALVAAGTVAAPDLIKVDVEGHELDVLRGARETIAAARPAIVFEFNERTARVAGWSLAEVAELLLSTADYAFSLITLDGNRPLDPFSFRLERNERLDPHVDVLARPAPAP